MRSALMTIGLAALACVLAWPATAKAYGPSIHIREADAYLDLLKDVDLPGPEHDRRLLKRNKWELRLGAIWPDLARILVDSGAIGTGVDEGMVDPHNRHLNYFMLQDAIDSGEEWKIAFAVGCLMHNVGDSISQGMLVEHMNVRGHLGEMDLLPGTYDDHPGGETEGLIEGGMEVVHLDLGAYLGMAFHFLIGSGGSARLTEVLDYYNEIWSSFFGQASAVRPGSIKDLRYMLGDLAHRTPPCNHHAAMRYLADPTPDPLLSPDAVAAINQAELDRVFGGPAGTAEWWNIYYDEGYHDLAPFALLTYAPGQGYYDNLPNWSSKMMKSGSMQGLNEYLPGEMAVEDGWFVSDLYWVDDTTGHRITSYDADANSSSVTAYVSVYAAPGRTKTTDRITFTADIVQLGGNTVPYGHFPVNFVVDPMDVDGFAPQTITITVDATALNSAQAVHLSLSDGGVNDGNLPFFTTDWSGYDGIDEVDMSSAAYDQYATFDLWPQSLRVTHN
ncbi:MAG: hypothetical protein H6685_08610 [Deltaproteobacteria bacterium]|nr:hypothetical protein [Deltaproteobacteria bacterium]